MLQFDTEYYRLRAAAEREQAGKAANRDIAAIHEELARQYEALIDNPELRGVLRTVG